MKVDQIQFGFMPGRSTVEAIFILRRMQESYREKNRKILSVLLIWKRLLIGCQGR